MHNLNYINLAYETLPEDIYSFDFRNIEILYKKQIKTGDTVDCLYSKLEDSNIITIKNKETNSTNAILKIFQQFKNINKKHINLYFLKKDENYKILFLYF